MTPCTSWIWRFLDKHGKEVLRETASQYTPCVTHAVRNKVKYKLEFASAKMCEIEYREVVE